MTTFDLIALLITILIVVILLFFGVVWKLLDDIKEWQKSQYEKLDFINTQIAKTNGRIDKFIPAFKKLLEHNESIENFWAADSSLVINLLKEIRNCLTQEINWGELTDEQQSEILYRLTHPVVESPFKPPFNPTCETINKEK